MKYLKLFENSDIVDKIQDIKDVFQDLEDEVDDFDLAVSLVSEYYAKSILTRRTSASTSRDKKYIEVQILIILKNKNLTTRDDINNFTNSSLIPKIKRLEKMNISVSVDDQLFDSDFISGPYGKADRYPIFYRRRDKETLFRIYFNI